MIGGLKTTLCALAIVAAAAPAAIVYAGTDDTEQSAFREAVKFGFSGQAIQGG